MAKRQMTDEQLEAMGRKLAQMHVDAMEVWRTAMRAMPLQSKVYRDICKSGRHIQTVYYTLREEAYTRGWPEGKIAEVFFSNTSCGFS